MPSMTDFKLGDIRVLLHAKDSEHLPFVVVTSLGNAHGLARPCFHCGFLSLAFFERSVFRRGSIRINQVCNNSSLLITENGSANVPLKLAQPRKYE
jgi:hypothetical protein